MPIRWPPWRKAVQQIAALDKRLSDVEEYAIKERHVRESVSKRLHYLELQAEVIARHHLPFNHGER